MESQVEMESKAIIDEFTIRQIQHHQRGKEIQPTSTSCDWEQEVALRHEILRKPLGLAFTDQELNAEFGQIHLGAFVQVAYPNVTASEQPATATPARLVGVVVLVPPTPSPDATASRSFKMRQLAVSSEFQRGHGIGSRLVKFSEEYVKQHAGDQIMLHARKTAVPFYLKLGYEVVGEEFVEVGIPHLKMFKRIVSRSV